jgi:hypothetical protein
VQRFVFVIDKTERVLFRVADDEARDGLFDRPGREETAGEAYATWAFTGRQLSPDGRNYAHPLAPTNPSTRLPQLARHTFRRGSLVLYWCTFAS